MEQHLGPEANRLGLLIWGSKSSKQNRLTSLRGHYQNLLENSNDETVIRHTKAYLLYIIRCIIVNNSSQNRISPMYLPLLNLEDVNKYAWGCATFANLIHSLDKNITTMNGFTHILTVKLIPFNTYFIFVYSSL
ncbi:Aminotransferase-like mobile domain containing protein [Trema orientale]|uniref:Aminotransferase-like mobile domain containing protein n=1 Tax=Trema orientale TaxID=63057 RepID=A0A2P5D2K7_TREOI|nr:Aminotransferase-like mobile domain containing protein [Trema orientale]